MSLTQLFQFIESFLKILSNFTIIIKAVKIGIF